MKKLSFYQICFCSAFLFVVACGGGASDIRDELGFRKKAPDEFRVVKRAPLELPPEYQIRPPRPGAERPQEPPPRERAQKALIGGETSENIESLSAGEKLLLKQAGAEGLPNNIRDVIEEEAVNYVDENTSVAERLGLVSKKRADGTLIDPKQEAKKLKEEGNIDKVVSPVYGQ